MVNVIISERDVTSNSAMQCLIVTSPGRKGMVHGERAMMEKGH